MTRDQNGNVRLGWLDVGKMFSAMFVASSVPVVGAMIAMYGDKRVIEERVEVHSSLIKSHSDRIDRHESRLTTIEARGIQE